MTYKIKLVMKKIFSGKKVLFDIYVNFILKELTTQFIMPLHIFFSDKLSQVILFKRYSITLPKLVDIRNEL